MMQITIRRWQVVAAALFAAVVVLEAQVREGSVFRFTGTNCAMRSGSADPEGSVTAPACSLYLRTNGLIYKKGSGSGNTGWEELAAGSSGGSGGGGSVSALDVEALKRSLQGLAVYSGCAVTEDNAGVGMDVDVAACHIRLTTGVGLNVSAGEVTLATADGADDRIDLVWVNSSGTLGKTDGTPAATPVPPALPSNAVLLAVVSVPASDTTIANAQITDKRQYTRLPQWIRKAADESVTSNATKQNDDHFVFTAGASEVWEVRGQLILTGADAGDMHYNFTVPASTTGWLTGLRMIGSSTLTTGDVAFSAGTTFGSGDQRVCGVNTGNTVLCQVNAMFVLSTTPGSIQFIWSQAASDLTATTVKASSWMLAIPLF